MSIVSNALVQTVNRWEVKYFPVKNKSLVGLVFTENKLALEKLACTVNVIVPFIASIAIMICTATLILKIWKKQHWRPTYWLQNALPVATRNSPAWLPLFRHRRLRFASKCRVHGNHFKLRLSAICTSVEAWPSQNCKQSQGTHTHWHCYRFCCPGQVLILLHLPVFIINTPTGPVYGRNTSRISEANKEGIANVNQTCITKSKSVLNVVYLYRNK